jgi:hypothetical protein
MSKRRAWDVIKEIRAEWQKRAKDYPADADRYERYGDAFVMVWHLVNSDARMNSFQGLTLTEMIVKLDLPNNAIAILAVATYINSCNDSGP